MESLSSLCIELAFPFIDIVTCTACVEIRVHVGTQNFPRDLNVLFERGWREDVGVDTK